MASALQHLSEGSRIFLGSWRRRLRARRYEGDATKICQTIVQACWNGKYFETSPDNFPQFWTRDFGWCVQSLLELGYKKEVLATLRYAMHRFRQHHVTTTITPAGKPFDFPKPAIDSLPWFIHALRVSGFGYYDYRHFLNHEIQAYLKCLDQRTGLVLPEHFSSMKDFAIRQSSCYDVCMVGMLAKDLAKMKLHNPLKAFDYPALLEEHYWQGSYFYDDLTTKEYVAGDANLFPFVCALADVKKLPLVLKAIKGAGLTTPLPLKYTGERVGKFIWQEMFLRDYESTAIWTHMGPLYIKLVGTVDAKAASVMKEAYTATIAKHGDYLEVFTAKGEPYKTPFYYTSGSMLWAANYLTW